MNMIIKNARISLLSFSLVLTSGAVKAFEILNIPLDILNVPLNIIPEEAEDGFLVPDWFDGDDHSLAGIRLSLRNFRQYYREADELYGYGMPSPQERSKAFYEFANFALDNVQGIKTNSPPLNSWSWGSSTSTPLIPLINRVVSPVNKEEGFRRPLLPTMRWTRDGRVGILGSATGVDGIPEPLTFHLNKPETLTKSLLDNPPGITSLDNSSFKVPYSEWGIPGAKTAHTVAICDPAPTSNPYSCGNGGQDDCYDVTLMGSAVKHSYLTSGRLLLDENQGKEGHAMSLVLPMLEKEERIFSRQMTVRVRNPKTRSATIEEVKFSDEFQIAPIRQGVLFEMNLPADGRLVVVRRSGIPLVWRHTTTGETHFGSYDTVYAVAPDDAPACDASQFGELRPISHAPFDPLVKNKYAFAKYPFRDPMGNPVPDGEDIKGTYPWLDMDAKVLSLTVGDAELYNGADKSRTSRHRYKSECLYPRFCDPASPDVANNDRRFTEFADQGLLSQFAVMGAWTKGKMVVMDNMLNYSDFRFGLLNAVNISLYQPGTALASTSNKSHKVEVSASRELAFGSRRDQFVALNPETGQQDLEYLLKNTTFFDSIEHRVNFNKHMRPAMPQDVVWTVSSGATSDELSFDDLLNNNSFIISEMVAAYSRKTNHLISPFRMVAYDGWNARFSNWSGQVKVQNSATTLPDTWRVPNAGEVFHGRIEPVANGGIKGKGMYFNGRSTSILYDIQANQPQDMTRSSWFYSLFIDARELSTAVERVIIDFPDRSRLTLADKSGPNVVFRVYDGDGNLKKTIEVPQNLVKSRWFHLGIQTTPGHDVIFFVNGYPYSEFTSNSVFKMTPGDLALGLNHNQFGDRQGLLGSLWNGLLSIAGQNSDTPARHDAFKGWMDDFKVFAYQPDFETVCNFAHGTLLAPNTNRQIQAIADIYPQSMHDKISAALQMRGQWTAARYACFNGDQSEDKTAQLHNLPEGTISIREMMHFPEGPIYYDAPRPDSTTNEFCLACHSDNDLIPGLRKTAALEYRPGLMAKKDPRRQPTQPPAFITGNIPHGFSEANHMLNNSTSNYIDEHLMPSSAGVIPHISNLVAMKDGVNVSPVESGSTISTDDVDTLRLNTSGLTNEARFRIISEGQVIARITDSAAPFEIPVDVFNKNPDRINRVSVTVFGSNGERNSESFDFYVTDGQPVLQYQGAIGGNGGRSFDDGDLIVGGSSVRWVGLDHGTVVRGLSIGWDNGLSASNGSSSVTRRLTLANNEFINYVRICTGILGNINYVQIRTNTGRQITAGSGRCLLGRSTHQAPAGHQVIGFHGSASGGWNPHLNQLGVIMRRRD